MKAENKNKLHSRPGHNSFLPEKGFLSTREAARILCLAVGTVQKMVDNGILEAWSTAGGHRRICAASVRSFIASNKQDGIKPVQGARLVVLIAEDDPVQSHLYETNIRNWGLPIDLRVVPDGFAALIEAGKNTPDVMVIDLLMPEMNGLDLICRVRSDPSFDNTDLLVITGLYPEEISAEGGLPADVVVIEKPIPFEMLYGFMRARLAAKLRCHTPG